ncbi:MAG TPA: UDP-N-acetylmuramoyl-tripeptide--D-alanyl-D-alanine ligase [bacterium]|nr:UDP-N-acetylmuramoyl-tripeptide--D-alanyl-D-alanine ligase [bacterium]
MKLKAQEAARMVRGTVARGEGGRVAHGLSTDSRKHRKGEAFVALKGPNFDGHDFIVKAAKNGAPWVMAERGRVRAELPGKAALIEVDDTLAALGRLAAAWRRRYAVKVAAITGSLGKSTTKEMAAAVLSVKGRVLRNQGNLNNRIGLPLTLFKLDRSCDYAVLEMGTNEPGEIGKLTAIAAPAAGLITRVAPVHLLGLGSLEGVARAKAEMIHGLPRAAAFILNLDDPLIARHARAFKGKTIGYSSRLDARFAGESLHLAGLEKEVTADGPRIVFKIQRKLGGRNAGRPVQFYLSTLSRHDAVNALAACALGRAFAVSLSDAAQALKGFKALPGRGEVARGRNGAFIMNDTYNASPAAVADALDTVAWWKGPRRGLAALGEMLELGRYAEQYHREAGAKAAAAGMEILVARGPHAAAVARAAVKAGMRKGYVFTARDNAEAARILRKLVKKGDWVLVKGSRAMGMEEVARALMR